MSTVRQNTSIRLPSASELGKSSLPKIQTSPLPSTTAQLTGSGLSDAKVPEVYNNIATPISTPNSDPPILPPLGNVASSLQTRETIKPGLVKTSKSQHQESNASFSTSNQQISTDTGNSHSNLTPNYRWGAANTALRSPTNNTNTTLVTPVSTPHGNKKSTVDGLDSRKLLSPPQLLSMANNTLPSFKAINNGTPKLPPLVSSLKTSPPFSTSRDLPPPPLLASASSPKQQPVFATQQHFEQQPLPHQFQQQPALIQHSIPPHIQQGYPHPQYQKPPNACVHPQYQHYPPGVAIDSNQIPPHHLEIPQPSLPVSSNPHPHYLNYQQRQQIPPHPHSGMYTSQLPPGEQYPPSGPYQPPYYPHQYFHSPQGPSPLPHQQHGPPPNMVHPAGLLPIQGNPPISGSHQLAMAPNQQHMAPCLPPQPLAGSMYPPPPGLQQTHLYYPDYQARGPDIDIASSREIKRRTKTGCLTCRKRRIKCDERHPTCYNCDKSKRVCLGYDPVFKVTSDRRTRKTEKTRDTSESLDVDKVSIKKEEKTIVNSAGISVEPSNFNTASRSPSPDTANTTPPSQHSLESSPGSAGSHNKMTINSLLDAAAVIDRKSSNITSKRRFASTAEDTKQNIKKIKSFGGIEDEKCNSWDMAEKSFHIHIAKFLDDIFATSRFTEMQIVGLAHACGLPMDGNGTVVIPANSGGTAVRSDPSYNSTFTIGQHIATLEAVRQLLLVLCPKFSLDNLSIDEGSVGKLEELRVGNDYKLLRAIFQLITADNTTLFLPVSEKDEHILACIQSLYQFVAKRDVEIKLEGVNACKNPANRPSKDNINERIAKVFSQNLADHSKDQIWELLILIAAICEPTAEEIFQLSTEQEKEFLLFVKKNACRHQLRVPLLLGAHFYLSMRRPQGQDLAGIQDYIKQQLIENSTSFNSNVVTRKLISMLLN